MTGPAEAETAPPSEAVTPADLDGALLVLIVAPTYESRCWTADAVDPAAYARILRALADQMDPYPTNAGIALHDAHLRLGRTVLRDIACPICGLDPAVDPQ